MQQMTARGFQKKSDFWQYLDFEMRCNLANLQQTQKRKSKNEWILFLKLRHSFPYDERQGRAK